MGTATEAAIQDDATTEASTTTSTPAPVDSDGDGLTDAREQELGTNPHQNDSDSDGLADAVELQLNTDPTVADTDGDSLVDGREVSKYGTNPRVADSDRDGLSDSAEVEGQSNPTRWDTDRDGLNDQREATLGTNPSQRDTDGDGIPDGLEVKRPSIYPDADPLRKDVYVEVDYMTGNGLSRNDYNTEEVVEEFATAPVTNPDGTEGIALHIRYDEAVPYRDGIYFSSVSRNEKLNNFDAYEAKFRDFERKGYHYALGVNDLQRSNADAMRLGGMAGVGKFAFEPDQSVFAHELGHSLGLKEFRGVDSEKIPYSEYPSVMSYNAPNDAVGYATGDESGTSQNDWSVITNSMGRGLDTNGVRARCVNPEFAGGVGTESNPYEVETVGQLSCIRADLDANYELTADINAAGRTGFRSIGGYGSVFRGTLDGNGHAIRNLTLRQPHRGSVALFGVTGGTIHDLRITDADVVAKESVAILAHENRGVIRNVTVTGTVSGSPTDAGYGGSNIGGVVVTNGDSTGNRYKTDTDAKLVRVKSNVNVTGKGAGGVAVVNTGRIVQSAALGDVNGAFVGNPGEIGGLVGTNVGRINQSFATGNVTGGWKVGGLAGVHARGRITDSFANGTVHGHHRTIGGLIGHNMQGGTIDRAYSASRVTTSENPPQVGGVIGKMDGGTVTNTYWNVSRSGVEQAVGDGSADIFRANTREKLSGLDFEAVWQSTSGNPTLQWASETRLPPT
ncbi:hypothetical protein [Haloarcula rubripromontorii]|uniref:hypothetical protein n=1 Tax=Haloarcula rubripromontorii TaxID=1705562 RepID=UPI0012BA9B57|nr:hypothetical protein [Haloarcula rubripromontorii]